VYRHNPRRNVKPFAQKPTIKSIWALSTAAKGYPSTATVI
jgi:hypothetical protein